MYLASKLIFKQNFRYFVGAGLLLLAFEALTEIGMPSEINGLFDVVLLLVLSFFIVASASFGMPFAAAIRAWPAPWARFWRYGLKYLAIAVIALLPPIALALLSPEGMPRLSSDFAVSHFVQLVTLPLALAFIGTWLAATVFDMSTGFTDALRRSGKVFIPLAWRLALVAFVNIFLRLIFGILQSAFGKAPKALVFADDGNINIMTSIFILVIYLVDLFALTLTNVAISRQFLKAEGIMLPPQGDRNLPDAIELT
jgi:hypothetical protein